MSVTPATGGPAWGGYAGGFERDPEGACRGGDPRLPPGPLRGGRGSRVRPVGRGLPAVVAASPQWPADRFVGSGSVWGSRTRPSAAAPHPGASAGVAGAGGEAGAEGGRRRHPGRPGVLTEAIVGAGSCPQGQPIGSGGVRSGGAGIQPRLDRRSGDRWRRDPTRLRSASGGGTGAGQASGRGAGRWTSRLWLDHVSRRGSHRHLRIGPAAGHRGAGGLRPGRAGDRLDDRLPGDAHSGASRGGRGSGGGGGAGGAGAAGARVGPAAGGRIGGRGGR